MTAEVATADLGRRLGARVLDWLLVVPVVAAAQMPGMVADGVVGAVLGLVLNLGALAFVVYNQVVRVGRQGQSFGKQWLTVRVVDERGGAAIGIGRALARELVLGLLAAVCLLPALVNVVVLARDPRRQGWHDKAAASRVVSAATDVPGGEPASDGIPAPGPAPDPASSPPPAYAPAAPPPAPVTPAPPPPVPAEDDAASETVSRAPDTPSSPPSGMVGPPPGVVPPPPSQRDEEPSEVEDHPVEETVMRPRAGQSPPTVGHGDGSGARWTISAPDGSSRVIDGPVLVGRDPDPALVGGAAAWAIDDPQLTMSKTHALLGIDADGVAWVEDWHATNGVALHRGEAALVIEPHARTPLRDGDVIEFGAYRVTVEAGS